MENVYVRVTRGTQPFLYDCFAIPQGKAPVEICRDKFFGELIDYLGYINYPINTDCIDDYWFAKHLMYIAALSEYVLTIKTDDTEQYMKDWLTTIKNNK